MANPHIIYLHSLVGNGLARLFHSLFAKPRVLLREGILARHIAFAEPIVFERVVARVTFGVRDGLCRRPCCSNISWSFYWRACRRRGRWCSHRKSRFAQAGKHSPCHLWREASQSLFHALGSTIWQMCTLQKPSNMHCDTSGFWLCSELQTIHQIQSPCKTTNNLIS